MFLFLQRKEKWSDVVHCSVQQHQITQFSDKVKVFFFLICMKVKMYPELHTIAQQRQWKKSEVFLIDIRMSKKKERIFSRGEHTWGLATKWGKHRMLKCGGCYQSLWLHRNKNKASCVTSKKNARHWVVTVLKDSCEAKFPLHKILTG